MERPTTQENPLEIKNSLNRTARAARLLYFSAELGQRQTFDHYEVIQPALCRKITSTFNSIIQEGGRVIILDFPYASGNETARFQVVSKSSYSRQLFHVGTWTRAFKKGHFSVSLTKPTQSNVPGALNFAVKENFGKDHVYTTSWNEEETPERRFTIMTASKEGWKVQLDFKWPKKYDPASPAWKVNTDLFA